MRHLFSNRSKVTASVIAIAITAPCIAAFMFWSSKVSNDTQASTAPFEVQEFIRTVKSIGRNKQFQWGSSGLSARALDGAALITAALAEQGVVESNYKFTGMFEWDTGLKGESTFVGCGQSFRAGDIIATGKACTTPTKWSVVTATSSKDKLFERWQNEVTHVVELIAESNGLFEGSYNADSTEKICTCVRAWRFQTAWGDRANDEPVEKHSGPQLALLDGMHSETTLSKSQRVASIRNGCAFSLLGKCVIPQNKTTGAFRVAYLSRHDGKEARVVAKLASPESSPKTFHVAQTIQDGKLDFTIPVEKPGALFVAINVDGEPVKTFQYELVDDKRNK